VAAASTFDRFGADNLDDPYPLYRRLRAEQPVFYSPEFDVWVVSRYDHVLRVLMDPTRFSSAFPIRTPAVPTILAEGRPEVPALVNEDPPEHRRTRDLVAKVFSARRIAGLQPQITELVSELLDGIEPRGRADLVAEFARPLALRAICTLLGLPAWDVARIEEWTGQLARLTACGATADEQRAAAWGSVEFERYLAAAVSERRAVGRDDLLTDLVRVRAGDAAPLTDAEIVSLAISLVLAGHGTTADLLASALVLLLHRPQLWAAAGDRPELVSAVVEETLRIDAPVQGAYRRAVFDVQISGVTIPAGTVRPSTGRTSSTPAGRTGNGTSPSAAASTTASAPRWPGWRRRPAYACSANGSRRCSWTPASASRTSPTSSTAAPDPCPPPGERR
jgi:cytochrome P450